MQDIYLTMADSQHKLKKSEWLRRWIDLIFGFENKKGEVLDYKLSSADGVPLSPLEFYANVERQIGARDLPGMEVTRQEFAEGGLMSDQRTYLRLMRERLAIDTCAGPFGKIFFFSSRTVYIRAQVRLWHILTAIVFFYVAWRLLIIPLGILFGAIAVITLVFALAGVLRNARKLSDLDAILLRIPVVGTIYEDWFREDTYYREDTRNLYVQLLPALIQEIAAETCAAKGVKLQQRLHPIPQADDLNTPLEKKSQVT